MVDGDVLCVAQQPQSDLTLVGFGPLICKQEHLLGNHRLLSLNRSTIDCIARDTPVRLVCLFESDHQLYLVRVALDQNSPHTFFSYTMRSSLGLLGLAALAAASDVHDLTKDTFGDFVKEHDLVLAECTYICYCAVSCIYANNCGI